MYSPHVVAPSLILCNGCNIYIFLIIFNLMTKKLEIAGNKNVDIKFSAHNPFLEESSSGTLKIERLESQII